MHRRALAGRFRGAAGHEALVSNPSTASTERARSYGASEAAYAESFKMSSSVSLATAASIRSDQVACGHHRATEQLVPYVAPFLRRMIQCGHFAVSR